MKKEIFVEKIKAFYTRNTNLDITDEFINNVIQEAKFNHINDCIIFEDDYSVISKMYCTLCITEKDSINQTAVFLNFYEEHLGIKTSHCEIEDFTVVKYNIF